MFLAGVYDHKKTGYLLKRELDQCYGSGTRKIIYL